MTTSFEQVIADIVKEQSQVIGVPLAYSRVNSLGFIEIYPKNPGTVRVSVKELEFPKVLESIVSSYEMVFGQPSVDVCIRVLKRYPLSEINTYIPESLKKYF